MALSTRIRQVYWLRTITYSQRNVGADFCSYIARHRALRRNREKPETRRFNALRHEAQRTIGERRNGQTKTGIAGVLCRTAWNVEERRRRGVRGWNGANRRWRQSASAPSAQPAELTILSAQSSLCRVRSVTASGALRGSISGGAGHSMERRQSIGCPAMRDSKPN